MNTLTPHPRLFVRWFVQYNPMFTASALCVLGGVLLVSCTLGTNADVILTFVLEAYQWLLIGTAALLSRKMVERRAAAILGLIELVFLVDPTLQLASLAGSESYLTMTLWLMLFCAKWSALAWAFELKLNRAARWLPPVGALLTTLVPNARLFGMDDRQLPLALAAGVLAMAVAVIAWRPKVTTVHALGDVGTVMFPRLVKGAVAIALGGVVLQCWNATLAIGPARSCRCS
jgi:hypothetical protein